jgi:Helix-turn-helix
MINPKNRWLAHHKYEQLEAIGEIKIVYLFVDLPELLPQIESALILWFDPPLNVAGKSVSTSTKSLSRLPKYRKRKGLSQDDLARLSGLTKTTMQNWENGKAIAS